MCTVGPIYCGLPLYKHKEAGLFGHASFRFKMQIIYYDTVYFRVYASKDQTRASYHAYLVSCVESIFLTSSICAQPPKVKGEAQCSKGFDETTAAFRDKGRVCLPARRRKDYETDKLGGSRKLVRKLLRILCVVRTKVPLGPCKRHQLLHFRHLIHAKKTEPIQARD